MAPKQTGFRLLKFVFTAVLFQPTPHHFQYSILVVHIASFFLKFTLCFGSVPLTLGAWPKTA